MIFAYFPQKNNNMRNVLILFFLVSYSSFGQIIGGAIVTEGRDIAQETDFTIEGHNDGWATFTLAIDREGNVTSAQLKETSLKSSLDKIELRKYAMTLKFQSGTYFPKFHNAEVKVTMKKVSNPPQQFELEID